MEWCDDGHDDDDDDDDDDDNNDDDDDDDLDIEEALKKAKKLQEEGRMNKKWLKR